MLDEIYIKSALLYQRGTLFGHAVNYPDMLATTILSFMIKSLFGGPEFLARVLPVTKLNSEFQFNQRRPIIDTINSVQNGNVLLIRTDGFRVNQKFFSKFVTVADKPWLCREEKMFLLYDYVHIIKCIRNNLLTEKTGELQCPHNGELHSANWNDLEELYKLECDSLVKLSKLNKTSVNPKRQSVDTCLHVFCEETIVTLKTHPGINKHAGNGTILFLEKIVNFWRVVNVKGPGADLRF